MTTIAKLLAKKQQLLERLEAAPGPHERDEIERLLEQIDAALQSLDEAGPGISQGHE
jgi:predicted CopG family antitoxin